MNSQCHSTSIFSNNFKMKVLLLSIISLILLSHQVQANPLLSDPRIQPQKCRVYSKTSLYEALDKICYVCHEMFSHIRPNLRSECRSKCFRNEHFRGCVSVFAPGLSVGLFSKGYNNRPR